MMMMMMMMIILMAVTMAMTMAITVVNGHDDDDDYYNNRELKQLRRRPQRRLPKNKRFSDQNNTSARASRFLVHFFDVHCTTTTWIFLIWRFMEDVDMRRRIFLPLFERQ